MAIISLLLSAFSLGLRHGLDWDHIAAIGDLAGSAVGEESSSESSDKSQTTPQPQSARGRKNVFRSVWLASLYALGHGLVVVVLGILAIMFSAVLPSWIDPIMEKLVGLTLVVLGLWILHGLFKASRGGHAFKLTSRWMALIALTLRFYDWVLERLLGRRPPDRSNLQNYGKGSAFAIGMLHGVGAETGTQVLLITAVAGAGQNMVGVAMLVAFVVGMLITNTLVALAFSTGFAATRSARVLTILIGVATCIFSLVIGFMFLFGYAESLPDLAELWS